MLGFQRLTKDKMKKTNRKHNALTNNSFDFKLSEIHDHYTDRITIYAILWESEFLISSDFLLGENSRLIKSCFILRLKLEENSIPFSKICCRFGFVYVWASQAFLLTRTTLGSVIFSMPRRDGRFFELRNKNIF